MDRWHWYADRNRTAFDTTSLAGTHKIDAAGDKLGVPADKRFTGATMSS